MDNEETEDSIEKIIFDRKMVFGNKKNSTPHGFDAGNHRNIKNKEGIRKERIAAIERMMKADATREQIISYGYTEAEYAEDEKLMAMNA